VILLLLTSARDHDQVPKTALFLRKNRALLIHRRGLAALGYSFHTSVDDKVWGVSVSRDI
jgi:hypothetical protein